MSNVTPYHRDHIRHPITGRVLASVSVIGDALHLDMPLVLRHDEARHIGEALARWGGEKTETMAAPRTSPDGPGNGGAGGAAEARDRVPVGEAA